MIQDPQQELLKIIADEEKRLKRLNFDPNDRDANTNFSTGIHNAANDASGNVIDGASLRRLYQIMLDNSDNTAKFTHCLKNLKLAVDSAPQLVRAAHNGQQHTFNNMDVNTIGNIGDRYKETMEEFSVIVAQKAQSYVDQQNSNGRNAADSELFNRKVMGRLQEVINGYKIVGGKRKYLSDKETKKILTEGQEAPINYLPEFNNDQGVVEEDKMLKFFKGIQESQEARIDYNPDIMQLHTILQNIDNDQYFKNNGKYELLEGISKQSLESVWGKIEHNPEKYADFFRKKPQKSVLGIKNSSLGLNSDEAKLAEILQGIAKDKQDLAAANPANQDAIRNKIGEKKLKFMREMRIIGLGRSADEIGFNGNIKNVPYKKNDIVSYDIKKNQLPQNIAHNNSYENAVKKTGRDIVSLLLKDEKQKIVGKGDNDNARKLDAAKKREGLVDEFYANNASYFNKLVETKFGDNMKNGLRPVMKDLQPIVDKISLQAHYGKTSVEKFSEKHCTYEMSTEYSNKKLFMSDIKKAIDVDPYNIKKKKEKGMLRRFGDFFLKSKSTVEEPSLGAAGKFLLLLMITGPLAFFLADTKELASAKKYFWEFPKKIGGGIWKVGESFNLLATEPKKFFSNVKKIFKDDRVNRAEEFEKYTKEMEQELALIQAQQPQAGQVGVRQQQPNQQQAQGAQVGVMQPNQQQLAAQNPQQPQAGQVGVRQQQPNQQQPRNPQINQSLIVQAAQVFDGVRINLQDSQLGERPNIPGGGFVDNLANNPHQGGGGGIGAGVP